MNRCLEFSYKLTQSYNALCKPVCQRWNLPQSALDILMFLANNPDKQTARDIVEFRHIKANLVSVNVDRLVREGYLKRTFIPGDRRKIQLSVTEKAQLLIEEGRAIQDQFFKEMFEGVSPEARNTFASIICLMEKNLEQILKGAH